MPIDFPLPQSTPEALHLRAHPLAELDRLIRRHIDEGRYPGRNLCMGLRERAGQQLPDSRG